MTETQTRTSPRRYFPPTCIRCGYRRKTRENRSPICRDCSSGLTDEERKEWWK